MESPHHPGVAALSRQVTPKWHIGLPMGAQSHNQSAAMATDAVPLCMLPQ